MSTPATTEKGPQGQNLKACDKCANAGHPGTLIYFEKIGEDPATKKAQWKLHNKDGSEHEHFRKQGGNYRPPKRVKAVITVDSDKEATALLQGNKNLDLFAVLPSGVDVKPLFYVIVEKEATG